MTSEAPTTASKPAALPAIVQWTKRLEDSSALDALVARIQPVADWLVAKPSRADALHGMWLGHAVHPLLTDVPLGAWTSAMVLDLVGGRGSRVAAQRLVGFGLLASVPALVTGVAEWGAAGQREKRVGAVHAVANDTGAALYLASWLARRRGRQARGVLYAVAGSMAVGLGGYLGGHLTEARKLASRHPAYED